MSKTISELVNEATNHLQRVGQHPSALVAEHYTIARNALVPIHPMPSDAVSFNPDAASLKLSAKRAARRLVDERLNRETHQLSIRVPKALHDTFLAFCESRPDLKLSWKALMVAMMEEILISHHVSESHLPTDANDSVSAREKGHATEEGQDK